MNSDFEELKKVYVRERLRSPSLPHISKIKDQKAFIYLRKDYLRLFLSFIATIAALIYVDYTSSKVVETSFTGFYILLCCSIYSAILNFYLFNKLRSLDFTEAVVVCVEKFQKFKRISFIFQTYGAVIYAVVVSCGVYLYLQPILLKLDDAKSHLVIDYIYFVWPAYLLWVFCYTFIIKRRKLIKEAKLISQYITGLERLEQVD